MRKNRRGLEVQFMDSIDADISPEELSKKLHDAFRSDDASAQDFIDSVFKPSENSRYDTDFRELSRDSRMAKEHSAWAKDRGPIKDMRPRRHENKTNPALSAYWLRRIWLGIFYRFIPRDKTLDRWQHVARK